MSNKLNDMNVVNYWGNRDLKKKYCASSSIFRFISKWISNFEDKNILDIGFGHGADTLEFENRGASVYGLDLNIKCVDMIKKISSGSFQIFKAGDQSIPFKLSFDLIFSKDCINYLSDNQLKFFFNDIKNKLNPDGGLLLSFIEKDIKINHESSMEFNELFFKNFKEIKIHKDDNPIRFLNPQSVCNICEECDLKKIGSATLIESYDTNESLFRISKFLYFQIKG